jgi:hypothetical protein
VRDHFRWDDYRRESDSPREFMDNNYNIPAKIEVGEDGSVEGFEFRTKGGLSYTQFKRAAEGIFKLSHQIDTECSFHIHVGVKGIKHNYGPRMQAALVQYLIENISRVPASVRQRWVDVENNQYIKGLYESKSKYSFIHKHEQGTWEFRCFGNVKNARDAMQCLDLAIEAMQFAYSVLTGESSLLSDEYSLTTTELYEHSYHALRDGVRLSTILRREKIQRAA